jgi:hypothetical protein
MAGNARAGRAKASVDVTAQSTRQARILFDGTGDEGVFSTDMKAILQRMRVAAYSGLAKGNEIVV